MAKLKSFLLALVRNKWFCLFWLIFGCLYVTIYGALYAEDPYTEGLATVKIFGILFEPTMTATASVIGRTHFWEFKGWGLFQAISMALGILYAYRRYGYEGKGARRGKLCILAASICVMTCVIVPSLEGFGLIQLIHWSTALLFGIFDAIALGLLLLYAARKSKRALATFIIFVGMLAVMVCLLIFVGKGGAIESIPMWGAYVILFLLGYTNLYRKSLPEETQTPEREAATV